MSGNEALAAFYRELKSKVADSGISQKELANAIHKSESALSELLAGQRTRTPDWDVVAAIVEKVTPHAEVPDQIAYWKKRLAGLEREVERIPAVVYGPKPAPVGAPDPDSGSGSPRCSICDKTYRSERFGTDWHDFFGAANLLASTDDYLLYDDDAHGAWAVTGLAEFEAFRDEVGDVVPRLLNRIGDTVRRACHLHRVWCLHAAHSLLVVDALLASDAIDLIDSRSNTGAPDWRALSSSLLSSELFPTGIIQIADSPYQQHRARLADHYGNVLYAWRFAGLPSEVLANAVEAAVAEYEVRLGHLAAQCPELFVWAGLQDGSDAQRLLRSWPEGEAGRRLTELYDQLSGQHFGMEGLQTVLTMLARDCEPGDWPKRLSEIHRRDLMRPISPIGEVGARDEPARFRIPRLAEGYVNPAFKTALVRSSKDTPHIDSWWDDKDLRGEIQGFLASFISSVPTFNWPLIILGDPGTGKSLLTRLLVARLPPTDYLAIRVELRNTHADSSIKDQLTQALRVLTQREDVTWDQVWNDCAGVLPVLIFDGFDELLQAGGADHWGYLEELAEFQEASARAGRPVAVIVTSRTVVADQAAIPVFSVLLRLEPLDEVRIERWIGVWNKTNRSLVPLSQDRVLKYPVLAEQPLLLLMLALYFSQDPDPDTPAVDEPPLSRVLLYERLFRLFVRRQITKLERNIRPDVLEARIEQEIDHLSVVAFAMFNRGRQGVSAAEADHDLALHSGDTAVCAPEAKMLFGRFFFIHEARSVLETGRESRWYEFLHATFGEFLVARKIARMLEDLEREERLQDSLFGFLSFRPLTDRAQIVEDLKDLGLPALRASELFQNAHRHQGTWTELDADAEPLAATYRYACYSANLLVLALVQGRRSMSELVPYNEHPLSAWRNHTMFWSSQFSATSWDAFSRMVHTLPHAESAQDDLDVYWSPTAEPTAEVALSWLAGSPEPGSGLVGRVGNGSIFDSLRRSRLLHDPDVTPFLDAATPIFTLMPELMNSVLAHASGGYSTIARNLVAIMLASPTFVHEALDHYKAVLKILPQITDAVSLPQIPDTLTQIVLVSFLTAGVAGQYTYLPSDFIASTVRELAEAYRRLENDVVRDEDTWLTLLRLALADVSTTAPEETSKAINALVPPPNDIGPRTDNSAPESAQHLMSTVIQRLLARPESATRDDALLAVLGRAIDMEFRFVCDEYADQIFEAVSDSLPADSLTPLQLSYLNGP